MKRRAGSTRRIGLFGGTFNPVHLGHLRSAEEIREQFDLAKIIFIPAHMPPHKRVRMAPASHRLAMVRQAIRDNPWFEASDIELQRQGNSYSFETIDYFTRLLGSRAELFFIIGSDVFRDISTWKQYPHFFAACNFIIMTRPGSPVQDPAALLPRDLDRHFSYHARRRCFVHCSGRCIHVCNVTLLDIASTEIRSRLATGRSIQYLVPRPVALYIKDQNLY